MGDDSKKLASSSVFNALGLDFDPSVSSSAVPLPAPGQVQAAVNAGTLDTLISMCVRAHLGRG